MSFARTFLDEVGQIARGLDADAIDAAAELLARVRGRNGRLFLLGVGGGAANSSHAAADFRRLAGMDAYAPADNVAELTARANDEGWETIFSGWLQSSRLGAADALLILSVGGGSLDPPVSANLVRALEYARERGAAIVGIVGKDGGATLAHADVAIVVPTVHADRITPHTEAFQAVVWHLLVSHPSLKLGQTKWESMR